MLSKLIVGTPAIPTLALLRGVLRSTTAAKEPKGKRRVWEDSGVGPTSAIRLEGYYGREHDVRGMDHTRIQTVNSLYVLE